MHIVKYSVYRCFCLCEEIHLVKHILFINEASSICLNKFTNLSQKLKLKLQNNFREECLKQI